MTKEQYEQAKLEIQQQYGKAEYDMQIPANESAKKQYALLQQYKVAQNAIKRLIRKQKGQNLAPQSFEELADEKSNNDKTGLRRNYHTVPLDAVLLDENDLKPFNPKEQQILRDRYEDLDKPLKVIARQNDVTTQKLAAFLNSQQAKLVEMKVWAKVKRFKTIRAYLKLLESGDSRAIMRAAEDEKLISAEKMDLNVHSKPIDDPQSAKLLRELGDKMANNPIVPQDK